MQRTIAGQLKLLTVTRWLPAADRKAEKGRSSAHHRLHEDDTIYVEMNQLQRAGQVELIVNRASQAELTVSTGGSRGTPVPI